MPSFAWNSSKRRKPSNGRFRTGGSFTITKWRWVCDHEPNVADRVERLFLPHDWFESWS
jgi:sugar (pentulose or hexulose) kinase